jgi:hypothetical protein
MNHPVLTAIAASHAAFDEIAGVDPIYMSVAEKKAAMLEVARLRARADALDLALLAASAVDVAEETGARSTAVWAADATREAHGAVRHRARLATALDRKWRLVADALAAGTVNLAQARVIAEALDALPKDDLPDGILGKAEEWLVEQATRFAPRELRHLGRAVLQHLAPDLADQADRKRLEDEEARAQAATRLWFRPGPDGTVEGGFRLPGHLGNRLRGFVDAYANPKRPNVGSEFMDLPLAHRRGLAFGWLLEAILKGDLPRHGGTATAILVMINLADLVSGVGVATTSTGDPMTAEQARRMACNAGIIPVRARQEGPGPRPRPRGPVLHPRATDRDGDPRPGMHHPRLPHPRRLLPRPPLPTTMVEGRNTDLDDGKLLCPFHHHRAHHPHWDTHHHPDGTTTFTRRQ